jgi:hypothetical protein
MIHNNELWTKFSQKWNTAGVSLSRSQSFNNYYYFDIFIEIWNSYAKFDS